MWNNSKSLILVSWWVKLAFWGWLFSLLPLLVLAYGQAQDWILWLVYGLNYAPLLFLGYNLNLLLKQIRQGEIFQTSNVQYLRKISWACLFISIFLLLGGLTYHWFLIILAGFAGFGGLLMRVFKNLLSDSITLKEENDYTI